MNKERREEIERFLEEIRSGARQRRHAEMSCHEFQHGPHIDRMPVEDNAPCNKRTTLSVRPGRE